MSWLRMITALLGAATGLELLDVAPRGLAAEPGSLLPGGRLHPQEEGHPYTCFDEVMVSEADDFVSMQNAAPGCSACVSVTSPTQGKLLLDRHPSSGNRGPPVAYAQQVFSRFRRLGCRVAARLLLGDESDATCAFNGTRGHWRAPLLLRWPPARVASIVATGREDASTHRIVNIKACYAAMRRGAAAVHAVPSFTRLSVAATLQLMSTADVFFTPHGSSLAANALFLRQGALVAEVWWGSPLPLPANHSDRWLCYSRDTPAVGYGYFYKNRTASWFVDRSVFAALGLAYECLTARRVKVGKQQNLHIDVDFLQH